MTSESDETIQIYNVKEGRHDKTLLSKKYGVKLAKFTHTSSSIIYASTKQNGTARARLGRSLLVCRMKLTARGRCHPIPCHPRQLLHPLL